ncbi:MAG: adenylyltransferase/cytidyltransferase family protein [Patescibacteria group bacterium]
MKTVLSFGTFDLFHPGHEDVLRQAKALGDRLVVVVARDQTVRKVKGHSSVDDEQARLEHVRDCRFVDEARLGSQDDYYLVLDEVRPEVILLGYDQHTFVEPLEEELRRRGLSTVIHRAEPFFPEQYKTSLLRERLSSTDPS